MRAVCPSHLMYIDLVTLIQSNSDLIYLRADLTPKGQFQNEHE
jgi:hypothetical protein